MKKVKVYTKYNCPQCNMTKMVLDKDGVEYEMTNVEEDEDALNYVKEVLGLTSLPVVVVNDGEEVFSGFKPEKLNSLKEVK